MRNNKKIKAVLRKDDHWRAILTDTSPYEVPIIVSNDGLYRNLNDLGNKSDSLQTLIKALVLMPDDFTIPYRYRIVKDSVSFRQLSLLHPASEAKIAEFYHRYNDLIVYYASQSPFSVRFPVKVGGTYFFRANISDRNRYKNGSVDTTDVEKLVRNPASYFSYKYYRRLYNFFSAPDYYRLEKKYSVMRSLDVSKCFDSIYTHSIGWALKDVFAAKEHKLSGTFGGNFDVLMQKMNFNETNGICIGSECSRIFAEIILSKIDKDIELRLESQKLFNKRDYEIRRYVDNYYVFSNTEMIADQVQRAISRCLIEYNLHLNELKTESFSRPFYTSKSYVTEKANKSLEAFVNKFLVSERVDGESSLRPGQRIRNHDALSEFFVKNIKENCFDAGTRFDTVSNYVVGALCKRIRMLCDSYDIAVKHEEFKLERYQPALLLLLDVIFFFFTVHPTVTSSLRVAQAMVKSGAFLKENDPDSLDNLREKLLRWTSQLLKSPSVSALLEKEDVVPVEFLNIILALRDISTEGELETSIMKTAQGKVGADNYFTIVSKLFVYQDHPNYSAERDDAFEAARIMIEDNKRLVIDSHGIHLLLDILACPYIPAVNRAELLKTVWPKLNVNKCHLPSANRTSFPQIIAEIEGMSWFVDWKKLDLSSMIEKKELSAVY